MPLRLFFYINEILREYIKNLEKEDKKNKTGLTIDQVSELRRANESKASN